MLRGMFYSVYLFVVFSTNLFNVLFYLVSIFCINVINNLFFIEFNIII